MSVHSFSDFYARPKSYNFPSKADLPSIDYVRRLVDFTASLKGVSLEHFKACGPIDAGSGFEKLREAVTKDKSYFTVIERIDFVANFIANGIKVALYIRSLGVSFGRFWSDENAKSLKDALDLVTSLIGLCDQKEWEQLLPNQYNMEPSKKGLQTPAKVGHMADFAHIKLDGKKLFHVACAVGSAVCLLNRFKPSMVPAICTKNNTYGAVVTFETIWHVAKLVCGVVGLKFIGEKTNTV